MLKDAKRLKVSKSIVLDIWIRYHFSLGLMVFEDCNLLWELSCCCLLKNNYI